MGIRYYKPYTPGTRDRSVLDFKEMTSISPEKSLTGSFYRANGRNNRGIITMRHRGGGHKRLYRQIDFKRSQINLISKVKTIEYDPNRNARICLLHSKNGMKNYILHARGLKIGQVVQTAINAPILVGNCLPLQFIPLGTEVHNVELHPGAGSQLARAAGAVAKIISKEGNYVSLRLPSGEVRLLLRTCWATIGQVGNLDANLIQRGKAGVSRWLNRRPHVRGSAMNPVDHPHGGGEGRSPIGRSHPVDAWGNPALGKKTRKQKKQSTKYIVKRRKGFK
uniref:Large ribosomal subunit protein uL2c n=1 Tax=Blidingia minima TaxID=63414 RepID=A0A2Z4M9H9_9CHLO|nr:ribosomal protein L2 [Blidingia minima]AWX53156.1 ribosomal protein L2 [Blidingia minima]QPF96281.1 ribosomal protein L2 [Blidingia minima]QUX32838.1 50S ribosomal protein L2 [Blidingia minima]